eukprot:2463564-Pyramimonas_sp.AAC.1
MVGPGSGGNEPAGRTNHEQTLTITPSLPRSRRADHLENCGKHVVFVSDGVLHPPVPVVALRVRGTLERLARQEGVAAEAAQLGILCRDLRVSGNVGS